MNMGNDSTGPLQPCAADRILVVDDEQHIRDMFHRLLSCGVYHLPRLKIDLAVNGAEAVESFRTLQQGTVLMDLQMPVMDGEQAFREIAAICSANGWEKPAVLFVSGFDPPAAIARLVEENRHYVLLRKPVSTDALLHALRLSLDF
jgi:CheY-like chemotaxis protein